MSEIKLSNLKVFIDKDFQVAMSLIRFKHQQHDLPYTQSDIIRKLVLDRSKEISQEHNLSL